MAGLPLTTISVCLLMAVAEPQTFTIQAENRINVSVGGTANFSVKPSRSVKNGNWDFNGKSIGLWIGSSVSLSNDYKPRAEILTPNGSLLLKPLTFSDSGKYTVTMVPGEGEQASATITLHVLDQLNSRDKVNAVVIVGIVIAVLLCLGFISGLSAWLIKMKPQGMKSSTQGQNISSAESEHPTALSGKTSAIYENIPRNQKEKAMKPFDENIYMGLKVQEQSVYSELKRNEK
ncbi:uncharacterized protein LOC125448405 isoform X1 [Stegostoma tigrinum]|uniref:uncharacterized protein LOC125448405 isoform X1 n=1 Tax=Stegostoma tigrinum TaxID=3053191 RepID=UPI0028709047|nr:uncharacterized protein LOC125448405 isoform X1 [Stegostoma tigrinum]